MEDPATIGNVNDWSVAFNAVNGSGLLARLPPQPVTTFHSTMSAESEPPMLVVVTLPVTNILPKIVVISRMEEKILAKEQHTTIAELAYFSCN